MSNQIQALQNISDNEEVPAADQAVQLKDSLFALSQKLRGECNEDALLVLQAILCIYPEYADVHEAIGYIYADLSRWECARHHFEISILNSSGNATVFFSLGNVCMSIGDFDAAELYYKKSLSHQRFPEALLNLSVVYTNLGDDYLRLKTLESLVDEFQLFPQGFNNLGVYWYRKRNILNAIDCFRKALYLDPALAMAKYGLSHSLLMSKDYRAGFELHESRWGTVPSCPIRTYDCELWTGQNVSIGSKIKVTFEQGFGDTLQMLRFIPLLCEKFTQVFVEVQPALSRLVTKAFPEVRVVLLNNDSLPLTDYYCPIMSLPLAFGIAYDTIPTNVNGYIHIDKSLPSLNKSESGKRKIGICWRGGAINPEMLHRSLTINDVVPIFNNSLNSWFSLVKDLPMEEKAILDQFENVTDCASIMLDFYDTYMLIDGLDLVVTVDTAVAHLAAAMGKETIIILNDGVDWRWHLDDDVSAWYPNAKLLRSYNYSNFSDFLDVLVSQLTR